jgi:hypothetical protein
MKYHVLWVCCTNDVHDTTCIVKKVLESHLHCYTVGLKYYLYSSNIVIEPTWKCSAQFPDPEFSLSTERCK